MMSKWLSEVFVIIFTVFVVVGFTKKAGSSRKEKTRKR